MKFLRSFQSRLHLCHEHQWHRGRCLPWLLPMRVAFVQITLREILVSTHLFKDMTNKVACSNVPFSQLFHITLQTPTKIFEHCVPSAQNNVVVKFPPCINRTLLYYFIYNFGQPSRFERIIKYLLHRNDEVIISSIIMMKRDQ